MTNDTLCSSGVNENVTGRKHRSGRDQDSSGDPARRKTGSPAGHARFSPIMALIPCHRKTPGRDIRQRSDQAFYEDFRINSERSVTANCRPSKIETNLSPRLPTGVENRFSVKERAERPPRGKTWQITCPEKNGTSCEKNPRIRLHPHPRSVLPD